MAAPTVPSDVPPAGPATLSAETVDAVMAPNQVAVIAGSSSGIGRALALHCARLGMRVALLDIDEAALATTAEDCRASLPEGSGGVLTATVDVGRREDLEAARERIVGEWGVCSLLVNNAGIAGLEGGALSQAPDQWRRTLDINLFGIIHGCQVFVPGMVSSGAPGIVVNTGSKQGITGPPGNTAYNVSKAGVRMYTESLEHELRTAEGSRVSACLLVPGWVNTAIAVRNARAKGKSDDEAFFSEEKPAQGAWMPQQVVDFLVQGLRQGSFYIVCPDNDVTWELDQKRILWHTDDLVLGRPPLSRWHPGYKEAAKAYFEA